MGFPRALWTAAAWAALATPALAHGGQYRSPAAPADGGGNGGAQGTPTGSWSDWWWANRDRYLDLRGRLRQGDGAKESTRTGGLGATAGSSEPVPLAAAPDPRRFHEEEVLPAVTKALSDPNAEVRSAAAVALGKMGFARSFVDLQRALKDAHPDVRDGAILALGMVRDDLAVDQLRAVLRDPTVEIRTRGFAALAIGILGGEPAAGELLGFLDPEADAERVGGLKRTADLRAAAVFSIGQTGSVSAAAALRRMYASPTLLEPDARCCAALALGRLRDRDSIPLLLKGMRHRSSSMRQSAAIALGIVAGPTDADAVESLVAASDRDDDPGTRQMAMMALGRIGGPTARAALRSRLANPHLQLDAYHAVLALGIARDAEAGPALHRLLREDRDSDLRGALAIALGLLHRRGAAPDLRELAFGKGDPAMRGHALTALGLLGDGESAGEVRRILEEEPDPRLRLSAAVCLGLLRDPEAVPALARLALKGGSVHVRSHSCYFLGLVGNTEAGRLLLRVVEDRSELMVVRMHAVAGLGVLADRSPAPVLSGLAADSNPGLRIGPLEEVSTFL